ncbi:hypothetical protein COV18_02635 [Candidatus Woesearchaeota archaeon CG10_big_fil_rev_8_21_14_0_10_37_12]|nr:MAG: hypothetical protein COV18_02635 [Candidatus Woesearchaeota archaeon CG10_big_fil_rev_8_21_14_0_10_37_12]
MKSHIIFFIVFLVALTACQTQTINIELPASQQPPCDGQLICQQGALFCNQNGQLTLIQDCQQGCQNNQCEEGSVQQPELVQRQQTIQERVKTEQTEQEQMQQEIKHPITTDQQIMPKTSVQQDIIIPTNANCPTGFLLDTVDVSYLTGQSICKPALMNMMTTTNVNDYLSNKIHFGTVVWDDWNTYLPLVQKVQELTNGKTTDREKIIAITNWVKKSKDYSCPVFPPPKDLDGCAQTLANNGAPFNQIFDNPKGVCLDAAVITTAMLRVAGIPAAPKMYHFDHIVTAYYVNGRWESIDTTFCFDKTNCPDLQFNTANADNKLHFLYQANGKFNEHDELEKSGTFCEHDFCINHPFITVKLMPFVTQNKATIIYPATRFINLPTGKQLLCSLEFKDMSCDTTGCTFFQQETDTQKLAMEGQTQQELWDTEIKLSYELFDLRNIGYNKIELPTHKPTGEQNQFRFVCKTLFPMEYYVTTEFSLQPGEQRVLTYKDLQQEIATDKEFNYIKQHIKSITEDIGITVSNK